MLIITKRHIHTAIMYTRLRGSTFFKARVRADHSYFFLMLPLFPTKSKEKKRQIFHDRKLTKTKLFLFIGLYYTFKNFKVRRSGKTKNCNEAEM